MTSIHVEAKHSPLAWFLYFTKLQVTLDGEASTLKWGTHEFSVAPGEHNVAVSFGYLGSQRGPASATVTADEAPPVRLSYRAPIFMFSKGRMSAG